MNKAEFTDLIINPDKLGNEHIDTLKKIVADYPFFSTAQILLAKALLNTHHYEYEKQLKTTAISVVNREVLHQFLNNHPFEIEPENSLMRVTDELKAEKVSRPDFEIGKLEQEALLFEAQNIISNNEITTFETEKKSENTPESIVKNIEITSDNFDFSEPILENIVNEIPTIETETNVPIETKSILENTPEFITENIETKIDNFDILKPISENIVSEIPAIETDINIPIENKNISEKTLEFSENLIDNSVDIKPEIDFHLVETEGTLVRFVNTEAFLPDFDESSLFADEQNIETITKSVFPNSINNIVSNTEIEEKSEELIDSAIIENAAKVEPIEELIISNEPILESNIIDTIDEETFISNTIEEKEIVTLENVLDSNIITDISDNNNESVIENVLDSNTVTDISDDNTENIIENFEESEIDTVETADGNLVKDIVALKNDFTESEAIIDANNLNFFEWLKVNKNESLDDHAEKVKPNEIKNYEDNAFVDKIKQIIKSKAEHNLNKNIAKGIEIAHDNTIPFERKNVIQDSIEETVEIIELSDNIIEEVNVETVTESVFENDFIPINITEDEQLNNNFDQLEENTKTSFYTTKVVSILPDFDALKELEIEAEKPYIIFDKKEGLIPKYETPDFDPLFNNNYVAKVPNIEKKPIIEKTHLIDSNNEEEIINFDDFIIDNSLFENSFIEIYIPLPKKELVIEAKKSSINETVNLTNETSKSEIENILEKFMRENPSISRPKTEFFNPAIVAKTSAEEKDEIVSETLASIYLNQGLVKKSISTYEKLCLIYPLKNAYFAALINKIKIEHNIN
ncbi:MAG: hypothetical protein ACOYMA_05540 [Bacteroidia bacterium]